MMEAKQAIDAVRQALEAVTAAEKACSEAGFGGVHVLRPLELIA